MRIPRWCLALLVTCAGLAGLVATPAGQTQNARAARPAPVPVYQVDPFWPKPFKDPKWMMQAIPVMATDYEDHIWAISRSNDLRPDEGMATTTPPRGDCCVPAPEILEFDQQGNLLQAWGKPGYVDGWPPLGQIHTVVVDKQHNVWISGQGRGNGIQKFTRDGKLLWDFGHRGPKVPANQVKQNNQQTDIFPPGIGSFELDEDAREIFIADGFLNKRILVYDMDKIGRAHV